MTGVRATAFVHEGVELKSATRNLFAESEVIAQINQVDETGENAVQFLLVIVVWCLLFAVSWPLALALIVLLPILWLLALPFRLAGACIGAVFALVKALLFLPARMLGHR